MAQHDMNIANQGFPAFRADLNSALTAIANNSSGATAPSTTFAYQWWYDTSTNALKMRNADNDAWIEIGTFNQTTDSFTPSGVTSDKIEEGNSSVEVVDSGTGYVSIVLDGVEVGVLKHSSGDLTIGNGDVGLRFKDDTDDIRAWDVSTNTARDAGIDIGDPLARFKDLYLSGGVYLGGTGSANHLDDYEEGAWTPVWKGTTSDPTVTYAFQEGHYRKVGNLVFVTGRFRTDSVSGGSGSLELGGLPFSAKNTSYGGVGGSGSFSTANAFTTTPAAINVKDASNVIQIRSDLGTNSVGVAGLGTTANDNDFTFSVTYIVD